MLNKQVGNMYHFVTHTWNAIKGKCPHECSYCYMRRFPLADLRFDEKELKTDLGCGNYIFVGSSTDMWSNAVPDEWIEAVLKKCGEHENRYLFQSKNPRRFLDFVGCFPANSTLGTTIETNLLPASISKAPPVSERVSAMVFLRKNYPRFKRMVSIEPIMKFHTGLTVMMNEIAPDFVSIGADSKHSDLSEPTAKEINMLIGELKTFTEVIIKDNLKRCLKEA